jgi:hypothetical protein
LSRARRRADRTAGRNERNSPLLQGRVGEGSALMKRTFPLTAPGKDDARVRDKIRHELNKYVRRERQKKPPEGFKRWAFDCRIGRDAASAETLPFKEIAQAIDRLAQNGATEVYLEIVARPEAPGEAR